MASANGISVEQRLTRLEEEVRKIRERLDSPPNGGQPWWKAIIGTHENDPDFDEVIRLGKEIRDKDLVMTWRKRKRPKRKRKSRANKKVKLTE